VREAENGRIGLAQLQQKIPSCILLDLMMPEVDGFQVITALRQNKLWQDVPVIVITAKELTDSEKTLLHHSVEKVLAKGAYSREALLQEITQLVTALTE
jgi:CheY-like chemotaxis protein